MVSGLDRDDLLVRDVPLRGPGVLGSGMSDSRGGQQCHGSCLGHATAAVELILSASIAGVVSTGPEDAADGFEAGQSHRIALIPANVVEASASGSQCGAGNGRTIAWTAHDAL